MAVAPSRTTEFCNIAHVGTISDLKANYYFEDSLHAVNLIKTYIIQMSNVGNDYLREAESVSGVAADLGGMAKTLLSIFAAIELFFGSPFRKLDFAVSF